MSAPNSLTPQQKRKLNELEAGVHPEPKMAGWGREGPILRIRVVCGEERVEVLRSGLLRYVV